MRNIKNKGITYSNSKRPNIILLPFFILFNTIKERRVTELIYGIYCFIVYKPSPVNLIKKQILKKETLNYQFIENEISMSFRKETLYKEGGIIIIGEYDLKASARILYKDANTTKIYEPYINDDKVYHIHSICRKINNLFYVTVGDTAKYLDVFKIDEHECVHKIRLKKRLAGYTAITQVNGCFYAGSDFSYRPNFIINLDTGIKYFLPKNSYTEYIHSINVKSADKIKITTKKLGKKQGSLLIFNVATNEFESIQTVSFSTESRIIYFP